MMCIYTTKKTALLDLFSNYEIYFSLHGHYSETQQLVYSLEYSILYGVQHRKQEPLGNWV